MASKWQEAGLQTTKVIFWHMQRAKSEQYLGNLAPVDGKLRRDLDWNPYELPPGTFVLLDSKPVNLSSITRISGSSCISAYPVVLVMSCCEKKIQHSFKTVLPTAIRRHCTGGSPFCPPAYFEKLNAAMTIVCWDQSFSGFGFDGCSNCLLLGGAVRIQERHCEDAIQRDCCGPGSRSDSTHLLAFDEDSQVVRSWRFRAEAPLPGLIVEAFNGSRI